VVSAVCPTLVCSPVARYQTRPVRGVPFPGWKATSRAWRPSPSSSLQAVCWCLVSHMGAVPVIQKKVWKRGISALAQTRILPVISHAGARPLAVGLAPWEGVLGWTSGDLGSGWRGLVEQPKLTGSLAAHPCTLLSEAPPHAGAVQRRLCVGNDFKNIIKMFVGAVEPSKENSWEAGNTVGGKT